MFAQEMANGKHRWLHAEDSVHMMQFAHLAEQRVQCLLGFYFSQHPECAYLPLEAVLQCHNRDATMAADPTASPLFDPLVKMRV